jgi:hypothetical protein
MASAMRLAVNSVGGFVGLLARRDLHLRKDRLGHQVLVKNGTYTVFRDSVNERARGEPVVLVVGFRLRWLHAQPMMHWLFQRVCICTTPFWSGLPGFRVKLWLVDEHTKKYLGIYDWRGATAAQNYVNYLVPMLRFFSVRGSVWYELLPDTKLVDYLAQHAVPH